MRNSPKYLIITVLLIVLYQSQANSQGADRLYSKAKEDLEKWVNPLQEWKHITKPRIDSLSVNIDPDILRIWFAPSLSYYPFREESITSFEQSVKAAMSRKFRRYKIEVFAGSRPLDHLVPNYFRENLSVDSSRIPHGYVHRPVLVNRTGRLIPSKGLDSKSIALWHSHGYYFEMTLDRWEYQRAKLFGTVEDIAVMGYVVPYLTRMLENAGANVFLPRERDTQINEVIVDNNRSTGNSEVVLQLNDSEIINEGFLLTDTLFTAYNPFRSGTSLRIKNDSALFVPDIPSDGYYAVCVSYPARPDNCNNTSFIVNHTGGQTEYVVNQTIGGGTWIFLGTFHFRRGVNTASGSVKVAARAGDASPVAIDAVRFGGGMGNVARRPADGLIRNQQSLNENLSVNVGSEQALWSGYDWKISGKPRFLEAARYYLQYAGMPDSVYTPTSVKNDYNDDYQSRGNWVNYLMNSKGLNIPVDLSLAFHTDAGITPGDSVIGTLAIYSTDAGNGKFTDGTSRMASRDLADIIQTQVVEEIRAHFDSSWTRRGLWDRPYSEARRPDVPAVLLELLSHQNLSDQQYGLDPRFRFRVCRAIYKGMLKYLSYIENRDYVVQPLPVTDFAIVPLTGKKVRLSWEPVIESGEPSSKPDKYIVYTRHGENGFDNGTVTDRNYFDAELGSYDSVYSFKITAFNEGGESFDSGILSAGITASDTTGVLVVNGFDRISGPGWIDSENIAGVAWWNDQGVADHKDFVSLGDQYDYNRKSPWLDDDAPGWGASYSDRAGKIIPGNNFDFSLVHGNSIMAAGHSFFSISDEYFCSEKFTSSSNRWKTIDLVFGEEKSTPSYRDTSTFDFQIYTPEFMNRISGLTSGGANIFMSGSYIGSELLNVRDSVAIEFADSILHFRLRTGHAVRTGGVYATDQAKPYFSGSFNFNAGSSDSVYAAEAPDAIEPYGKGAVCSFRYLESNASAGSSFMGSYRTVALGFPFETIPDEEQRNILMKQILKFFEK